MKKRVDLPNGLLELTVLFKGRLILGVLRRGHATQKDLRTALAESGFTHGHVEKSLESVERGFREQLPLAVAVEKAEAPQVWRHYEKGMNIGWAVDRIRQHRYGDADFTGQVNVGDRLLTITSSPQMVREYPDGRRQPIRRLEVNHLNRIMGKNTRRGDSPNSIIAGADGCVTSSKYGIVSVYPIKYYRNVNRANRDMGSHAAVWVEQDVQPYSHINTPSNTIVEGLVKSATLRIEGNLHCLSGIENPLKLSTNQIQVGRHVYTRKIQDSHVQAGGDVVVDSEVVSSKIRFRRQMVVPQIGHSSIVVGNRLVVGDLMGRTTISLGEPDFGQSDLLQRYSYFRQRSKKIQLVEAELLTTRSVVESGLERIAIQLRKLRGTAEYDQKAGLMMRRFIMSVEESLRTYLRGLENYKSIISRHEQERVELSFLEGQLRPERVSEVIVLGQVEAGVTFVSPNEVFAVREQMKNVIVRLDNLKGTLEIVPGKTEVGSMAI
ncbi:MAG TPA: FapA family protein [Calditrichia bacterium]|nr:FapA family protein [Calditrichia bacterium]